MYPEGDDGGAGGAASGGGGMFTERRLGFHLEGLIPLILILIIAFLLAWKLGFISDTTPILGALAGIFGGAQPASMLIVGDASIDSFNILNDSRDLVTWRQMHARDLERNPKEQLAQYDIIMLYQSEADKSVSRELGEAIEQFVKTGGKLIVVLDSGIRRTGAYDVLGWEATFGDVVPVRCETGVNEVPSCLRSYSVPRGVILRMDEDHPIMEGIDRVPRDPSLVLPPLYPFDVSIAGNEIAVMQDEFTRQYFTAIVEKNLIVGKSIYFNYDPGKTPGIFEKTLEYLR